MLNLKKSKLSIAVIGMTFLATSLTACGGGSKKNPNVAGVKYSATLVDGYFLMSTTLQKINLAGGGRLPLDVAKLPNSYLEIGPDFQSNGTLIVVGLALADVQAASGAGVFDPSMLPGGRPLPGVSVGNLPGMAIQLEKLGHLALYFGNGAFGLFLPVNFGVKDLIVGYKFYADGARVGNIYLVGSDSEGKNAGLLVLVNKTEVNSALKSANRAKAF